MSEETIETALSELYVFLQKECSVILNSLFSDTLIDRDRSELTNSAFINDEEVTEAQVHYIHTLHTLHTYKELRKNNIIALHTGVQKTERAGTGCGSRYQYILFISVYVYEMIKGF